MRGWRQARLHFFLKLGLVVLVRILAERAHPLKPRLDAPPDTPIRVAEMFVQFGIFRR